MALLFPAGFGGGQFAPGDKVPGYVHRTGAGSRIDVRADATHDGSTWDVVFRRSLHTGDPTHDIQFAPSGTYYFQVATFDNTGGSGHDTTQSNTVFSVTLPPAPGPLVFSGTPAQFSSIAGQYLASDEIEIQVQWADPTKNDNRKEWTYDGSNWTQSSQNEDRVAFLWDMQGDGFASAGTCATMCHFPYMYTAPGTFVDTWHWKATRTAPAGRADDKYWDDGGGTGSGRHSDPGQSTYTDNADAGQPAFMAEGDPGANVAFLFELPTGMREATPFDPVGWTAGDHLPGYVHRLGSGSRVDCAASAAHDGSGWTVTFRRKLDTGDATGDISFAKGNTYYYQVATFDNTGGSGHDTTGSTSVYSMTIPAAPGPIAFNGLSPQLSSISGELLDSDEIVITVAWSDPTRNDARKEWSFDGAQWTQSSDNEDRIAFLWDMQGDAFASAGTCATMCHFPYMYTAPGTFVDTWHWKATRTAPAGFADDKYWDDGNGGTESGRHSDAGTSVYQDNVNAGLPGFMSAEGPGTSADFLADLGVENWSRAVPFDVGPVGLTLLAIDSDSIGVLGGNWNDNRIRNYWSPSQSHIDGFIKFDLSSIPDGAVITSMTLRTYHEAGFSNPLNDPKVALYRVQDDSWSRATVDPHPGLDQLLVAAQSGFPAADQAAHDWTIDVAAVNWQTDLSDDTLSLAMRNETTSAGLTSYVYWYGSDALPAPPELIVEYQICAGAGFLSAYGAGCVGSGGVTPVLSGSGCASPGETVTLRVDQGPASGTGFLLFGLGQSTAPVNPSCTIDILPVIPTLLIVLPLDANGSVSLVGPIPASLSVPADFYLQAFAPDPGTPGGVAGTNALHVHVE